MLVLGLKLVMMELYVRLVLDMTSVLIKVSNVESMRYLVAI